MSPRRPRTALQSSTLPSLAALLASGVALDGCDAGDAPERQQRLSAHGENAARDFQGSRVADGLREVGVGLGLLAPSSTEVDRAGAVPVVTTAPPIQPSGAIAPVQPTPPPGLVHPSGAAPVVQPTPPTPPTPPPPVAHPAVPGGLRAVHPQPPPPVEAPPSHR